MKNNKANGERLEKAVHEARNKAIAQKQWQHIILAELDGYVLEFSISPGGQLTLLLRSPTFRNRFIIKDEDALETILELLTLLKNSPARSTVFGLLKEYGYRRKSSSGTYEGYI